MTAIAHRSTAVVAASTPASLTRIAEIDRHRAPASTAETANAVGGSDAGAPLGAAVMRRHYARGGDFAPPVG